MLSLITRKREQEPHRLSNGDIESTATKQTLHGHHFLPLAPCRICQRSLGLGTAAAAGAGGGSGWGAGGGGGPGQTTSLGGAAAALGS